VGETSPCAARSAGPWPTRSTGAGQRSTVPRLERKKGGEATGPNPTDRGSLGSKRHLLVDGNGIPLALLLTAANRYDSASEGHGSARPHLSTLSTCSTSSRSFTHCLGCVACAGQQVHQDDGNQRKLPLRQVIADDVTHLLDIDTPSSSRSATGRGRSEPAGSSS